MSRKKETHKLVFDIPDNTIGYIVSRYLQNRASENTTIVKGISPDTVEEVMELFFEWAQLNGHVQDGVLSLSAIIEE